MNRDEIVWDIECSPNYFLIGFKKVNDEKVLQVEARGQEGRLSKENIQKVKKVMRNATLIGFNSARYDNPMVLKALEGLSCFNLFKMSETIIKENLPTFMTMNRFDIQDVQGFDSIDVSEPAPAVFVSLKGYGARLHSKKLIDLPYAYDKVLSDTEIKVIRQYNINDLDTTIDLYKAIAPRIRLREEMGKEYKLDLRSKSDAQIAELVIVTELQRKGIKAVKPIPPKVITYTPPKCIAFKSEQLNEILGFVETATFKLNPKNGQPILPEYLKKLKLKIGETVYQVGLGGLHSKEKKLVVIPKKNERLGNIDVKSYYPSMILEFGFYPKRFTEKFLEVYGHIYDTRNDPETGAKAREGVLEKEIFDECKYDDDPSYREVKLEELSKVSTISGGFKIVLNGSFGKLGSMYSKLYAPDLMLQVTLTGQLMLLMLIEELEDTGITVKSSNTDGIEFVCPEDKQDLLQAIVFDWELSTGMVMEYGEYKALYARDVNNYVAVYDGYTKAKGVYAKPSLMKNSEYPIVFEAIRTYLLDGTPLLQTLTECKDIRQFLTARTVKGGGVWNEQYLGKVVRFGYVTNGAVITYKSNGNKVAKSDDSKPFMTLPDIIPPNLDYNKYLELTIKHLEELGVVYDKDM